MFDLKPLISSFADNVNEHAPTLLAGLAIAGLAGTIYFTAKNTQEIKDILEEKKQDLKDTDPDDKETKRTVVGEVIKETAPKVLPIAACAAVTVACVIGSNKIHLAREAALTTAYIAADQSLKEWKDAAQKTLDKKDYEAVEKQVREDKFTQAVEESGGLKKELLPGQHIFIDRATNQIFYDNLDRILRIVDNYNNEMNTSTTEFVTWNELLMDLGEKPLVGTNGRELGFNSIHGGIKLDYGSYIDDDTNVIFGYIDYAVEPRYRYG